MTIDRRQFLKAGALVAGGSVLARRAFTLNSQQRNLTILDQGSGTPKTELARRELLRGLTALKLSSQVTFGSEKNTSNSFYFSLAVDPSRFKAPDQYRIEATDSDATLFASTDQALLYAVFEFLERQGIVFGIDGDVIPVDLPAALNLPAPGLPWTAQPRFAVRGLLPWPDFLNCISIYNEEDFQAYFANLLRMRFNMFGMHVYTQSNPLTESYLSYDFAGVGHAAALESTAMSSWGYLPQRTSTFKMGAAQFFDRDTFGSDATRLAADPWETAERTTAMMRAAFQYASNLGIRTGIGFEPYQNPAEILEALPPEAKNHPRGLVESNIGRVLLERRLADLLERYPMVDYVWLWEDEGANWESRKKGIPLSVTPFQQAHDFLRRHAPEKKLVLAGWGGVVRNFESLHQQLPEDIVFSALSDTLGWDPVHEAFGKLGSRERWPIPWLEDDPSMWFPQFRASKFQSDMKLAEDYGCQGMLGIHWRHRIVDPTATYFARAAWDGKLTSDDHYRHFCSAQASGVRAERLAKLFVACDQGHKILSTFTGVQGKDGHVAIIEPSGDYSPAFSYERDPFDQATLNSQKIISEEFHKLSQEAVTPTEKERLSYFSAFVAMMVPYGDANNLAHALGEVLAAASKLRAEGQEEQARKKVTDEGVPLWLKIAPQVRETMLEFQGIVATRNDLGQLASMQNKFVRIALERLRLSIQEFLGELPDTMQQAYADSIKRDEAARPRLFAPTRPSIMKAKDKLRLFLVAPGPVAAETVVLHSRALGASTWTQQSAKLAARGVYEVELGPFSESDLIVEYYFSASFSSAGDSTAPPEAPSSSYRVEVIPA